MILWISSAILFALTLIALILPLLRRSRAPSEDQEIMVYQDQLAEVSRDLDRDLLSRESAEELRLEINRRLKILESRSKDQEIIVHNQTLEISVIIGLILLIPVMSFGIYATLGSPTKEDLPFASRQINTNPSASDQGTDNEGQKTELSRLAENLADKMKSKPKSLDGWMLLGRTYMTLERWSDAATAFSRAHDLSPSGPDIAASYAEALYMVNGTTFTAKTKKILQEALKTNERDPKSLFYWGLALSQQNRHKAALQIWVNLITISNPDAPWMPTLRRRMQQSVKASGIQLTQIRPTLKASNFSKPKTDALTPSESFSGPTREDVEAASKMTGEDRMAFIRSMVERLADRLKDEPNDLKGWQRLARAYQVLGEKEKAEEALARIRALQGQ